MVIDETILLSFKAINMAGTKLFHYELDTEERLVSHLRVDNALQCENVNYGFWALSILDTDKDSREHLIKDLTAFTNEPVRIEIVFKYEDNKYLYEIVLINNSIESETLHQYTEDDTVMVDLYDVWREDKEIQQWFLDMRLSIMDSTCFLQLPNYEGDFHRTTEYQTLKKQLILLDTKGRKDCKKTFLSVLHFLGMPVEDFEYDPRSNSIDFEAMEGTHSIDMDNLDIKHIYALEFAMAGRQVYEYQSIIFLMGLENIFNEKVMPFEDAKKLFNNFLSLFRDLDCNQTYSQLFMSSYNVKLSRPELELPFKLI